MKKFIICINVLLLVLIPCTFVNTSASDKTKKIDSLKQIKYLNSTLVINSAKKTTIDTNKEEEEKETEEEKVAEETVKDEKVQTTKKTSTTKATSTTVTKPQTQTTPTPVTTPPPATPTPVTDVLETQVGKMSGYGPDCVGCGGNTAYGYYVGDGTTTYNDRTYGRVRILAGDRKYKFGTIIRVKNSKLGSFNAIVLDRGGDIGLDRKYMFDLLFEKEAAASQYGVSYNVTFEVLRYGF